MSSADAVDQELIQRSASMTVQIMDDLHGQFKAHAGQVLVGNALFNQDKKLVFIEAGRKWGKTEFILYTLYRWLLLNPNGVYYYIAPYLKQAKEIIWASRRLQNFLPPEIRDQYVLLPKEQELRIPARGADGFIKLDGADNYEAYRGVNPSGIIYEEFKDHRPEFHRGMRANLATNKAPLVVIGTPPPDADNHFCELAEEAKYHPEGAYFNMPTWVNPHIDRKWLKQEKESLYRMGRPEEWELEYACKRVKGTRLHVFGVLEKEIHVFPHYKVKEQLRLHWAKRAQYYCIADPAGSSCFAVLFAAIDPYTRKVFLLDEMYVTDLRLMSSRKMWDGTFATDEHEEMLGIKEKLEELQPDMARWTFIYDEAASWWRNEMDSEFKVNWMPTHKHLNDKNHGLSLIKDQLINKLVVMSDRCEKLFWEMINYIRDENGKVPKKNDHLIDCFRYLNGHEVMDTVSVPVPAKTLEEEKREERRGFKPEEDMQEKELAQHWETGLVGDL